MVASLRLQSLGSVVVALLRIWNLPGPGTVFPALVGVFLSTVLPGKSSLREIMWVKSSTQNF